MLGTCAGAILLSTRDGIEPFIQTGFQEMPGVGRECHSEAEIDVDLHVKEPFGIKTLEPTTIRQRRP